MIVDPVLAYSTYLGGSVNDTANAIAVDSGGNAYVTGLANSIDFPVTAGAYQSIGAGTGAAYVTRINPAGTALLYSTFLGPSYGGLAIAVDSSGDAFVTGGTGASDFPVTPGAFQTMNNGAGFVTYNAFVTKLNPTGTALLYSTFLGGGSGGDEGHGIAVDGSGNAYVTGRAGSMDFPVTANAFQPRNNAVILDLPNAFVSKIDPTGTALLYSTYLGGSGIQDGSGLMVVYGWDSGSAIAVDGSGHAYVTGSASSTDFPVTRGAFQGANHETVPTNSNAFVTELSSDGTALLYSTYLGGSSPIYLYESDLGSGIAVDSAGSAYVTGAATSTDFPVTDGAFQKTNHAHPMYGGGTNGFVAKLNPTGTGLVYSTYLGGSSTYPNYALYNYGDAGAAIAVDSLGDAYVTGLTDSNDFPITTGAFQSANHAFANQQSNAFIAKLNPAGTALLYSSYLGGSGRAGGGADSGGGDSGTAIAVDTVGYAYMAGTTASADFPVSAGAFQTSNKAPAQSSSGNAFVAKLTMASSGTAITTITLTADKDPQPSGTEVTFNVKVQPGSGSGTPTGIVSFSVDNGAGPSVPLDNTGDATYTTSSLAVGAHTITAIYSGDSNYSSGSKSLTETISPSALVATTTTLTSSENPAAVGTLVTATAFVQPVSGTSIPTGSITGVLDGTTIPGSLPLDSTGHASFSTSELTVGTHTLMVTYSGDANYASSTATITETITSAPNALQFIPVTPCRVADTRNATGPFGGPSLTAASTREFDIPYSGCGIPSTAVAYSLNTTVVPAGELDYLTLWPAGQPQPGVSTLNSLDGRIKANAAITPAGANGGVDVYVSDATNVILDIDGYFVPAGSTSTALAFYPLAPCRIADTRNPTGLLGGPSLAAATTRSFIVQSSTCNIPATAQAYSLNVTALPHTTLTYLTTWPTGETQPGVSTLNALTGAITANAAIVPAGNASAAGAVSIYVSDDADVILDVNGYFAPPATGGLSLYTIAPCRALDTRSTSGAFNGTLAVAIGSGSCTPPATAQAYVLNATVVPPAALTYLTLWPDGGAQPNVSTLNALDGAITSNMAIVPTNDGSIVAFSSNPIQLILDLSSYFAP